MYIDKSTKRCFGKNCSIGGLCASKDRETTEDDGDSGTSSGETIQKESEGPEDGKG